MYVYRTRYLLSNQQHFKKHVYKTEILVVRTEEITNSNQRFPKEDTIPNSLCSLE